MKKTFPLFILLLTGLWGCPMCDDTAPLPPSTLSDSALAMIPYQDGQKVTLIHSEGQEINFAISRENHMQDIGGYHCMPSQKAEQDESVLEPDYPLFSIHLSLVAYEQNRADFTINTGGTSFRIPDSYVPNQNTNQLDTITIHGTLYEKVFEVPGDYYSYNQEDTSGIYPETLYYNYQKGIIQLEMTNGETYSLYE